MGRRPCCAKEGLNRGAWSAREDRILTQYIKTHGEGKWRDLPQKAGLNRCGKSCRLRWLNYLRPDIKRGNISKEEEDLIIRLHKLLGNRWSLIAGRLPGRTDNEVKNYWNTNLSKKLQHKTATKNPSLVEVPQKKAPNAPHVIRTRAVRCTRVILPQQEGNDQMTTVNLELFSDGKISHLPAQGVMDDDDTSNYIMDFDIEELFISDVLNPEFLPAHNDGFLLSAEHVCENNPPSCAGYPLSTQEMLEDLPNEAIFGPNEALELKKLSSFLDSEEWSGNHE